MTKKNYLSPEIEVIEMGYRDPVCQATSSIPNYDYEPIDPGFFTSFEGLI